MLRRTTLLTILLIVILSSTCFAWRYTPRSYGIAIDNNCLVLGVNLNAPSYNAGILPGDIIVNISNKQSSDMFSTLHSDSESPISVTYKRNDQLFQTVITPEKLLDNSKMSTYLIMGTSQSNYEKLINILNFHSSLSKLFPITSVDSNLRMIRTHSNVTRKNVNSFPDYIVALGGSGFGFTKLETTGTFALANYKDSNYTLFKVDLSFNASWSSLFGEASDSFTSSGILERTIVEKLYDNI